MDQYSAGDKPEGGDAGQILAGELGRLLASPLFLRSPVLSRLLQFLVEHRLKGGRASPKAYAIATEALGRSADFDPAVDSYPRVMVGRLRNLLDRYYADRTWTHRLRVPQGSYEVVIVEAVAPQQRPDVLPADSPVSQDHGDSPASPPATDAATALPPVPVASEAKPSSPWPRRLMQGVGAVAALLLAAMGGWWWATSGRPMMGPAFEPMPTVEVTLPVSGETPQSTAQARALDNKLRDGMRRFETIQLLAAHTEGAPRSKSQPDYRLTPSMVRTFEGPVDVTLILSRVSDDRIIWSMQKRFLDSDIPEFSKLDSAIASIAGDYGIIVHDQLRREPENFALGYPCLAQYNKLRHARDRTLHVRVEACLRESIERLPTNAELLSALSLVRFAAWQTSSANNHSSPVFIEAQDLARRAFEGSPQTAVGLFALARAEFYAGRCDSSGNLAEAALEANPYDPDLLGYMGLFDLACGRPASGEARLRRSIELDGDHSGLPTVTLAFILAERGDHREAEEVLNALPARSTMEPQFVMVRAVLLAKRGDIAAARDQWKWLLNYTGQPATAEPETVLRQFVIAPAVIKRASAALRQSGVAGAGSAK